MNTLISEVKCIRVIETEKRSKQRAEYLQNQDDILSQESPSAPERATRPIPKRSRPLYATATRPILKRRPLRYATATRPIPKRRPLYATATRPIPKRRRPLYAAATRPIPKRRRPLYATHMQKSAVTRKVMVFKKTSYSMCSIAST